MKTFLITIYLVITTFCCYAQGNYGIVKKPVNLRDAPSTESTVIRKLKAQTPLFYFVDDTIGGYTKVRVIKTAQIGYVKSDYIKFIRFIKESAGSPFSEEQAEDSNSRPELRIFNNTRHRMTLSLNSEDYIFSPYQKMKVPFDAGSCRFVASAPNVIPLYGTKDFSNGYNYNWEFYIVTRYR